MLPSLRLLSAALLAISGVRAIPQAAALSATSSSVSTRASSKTCNNSPSLCDRKYNNITYLGAHDSAFLRDASTDNSIAGDQYLNATEALDSGLRFLQAQVHDKSGVLHLCHTSCSLLDAGSLESWLGHISTWMKANPDDVVTLLLVNSDNNNTAAYADAFKGSGLADYAYTPTSANATSDWPTLQEMIDKNTRLVSFVTYVDQSDTYPYILSEFRYIFETSFEVTQLTGFNCTLDRPSHFSSATEALSTHYMSLINHFKYQSLGGDILLTDVDSIQTVNSASSTNDGNLGKQVDQCTTAYNNPPNFILVDFWNEANPLDAADKANGISDATGRKTPIKTDTATQDGAAVNLDARNLGHGALLAFIAAVLLLV